MSETQQFKIILVGAAGSGKSTYIKRFKSGQFERRYTPTKGADIQQLLLQTNYGLIVFNVWDTAGNEKIDPYYAGADAALVVFDVTRFSSCLQVQSLVDAIEAKKIPIVICGNKVDMENRVVSAQFYAPFALNHKCYDISAIRNYNFEKPFLALARELTKHNDLVFIEHSAILPPEVA